MPANVTGLFLVWAVVTPAGAASQPACTAAAETVLEGSAVIALAGEFDAAAERLRAEYPVHEACLEVVAAAWSWRGWQAAEEAVTRGGTPESLAHVVTAIETLSRVADRSASHASYAVAVLRAAAAAAQHERDEMQVWLEHARDLAMRLSLTGVRRRWPLPVDLVDGELWSRVDDFELAEVGYARALAEGASAAAWRGLARARDRRGDHGGACMAYRQALAAVTPATPDGALASEARGHLRSCEP